MPILEGKGVTRYFGGIAAVSNVDFTVEKGQIFGLIGPNGAGKTTLFNLISSALPTTSGIILFKERPITGLKPHQVCRLGIARTFQIVKTFANMPVFNNVVLGAHFGVQSSKNGRDPKKEAKEWIDFVELSAATTIPAKDLTLADQKRLEVARALATQPDLLLLDEMMEGLNSTEVSKTMKLITRIRDKGITIIMIEHVMKAIMNLCDHILVMHHGEKLVEGAPQVIMSSEAVKKVYFGEKTNA
ncbi:MAG: ABC transporter ATP-binding protein [Desulfobacteraceae bacterium]|jgi:branched-chain amino acid transport system ATP-binding protein